MLMSFLSSLKSKLQLFGAASKTNNDFVPNGFIVALNSIDYKYLKLNGYLILQKKKLWMKRSCAKWTVYGAQQWKLASAIVSPKHKLFNQRKFWQNNIININVLKSKSMAKVFKSHLIQLDRWEKCISKTYRKQLWTAKQRERQLINSVIPSIQTLQLKVGLH